MLSMTYKCMKVTCDQNKILPVDTASIVTG